MDIRDMLRNLPLPGGTPKHTVALAFNANGEISGAYSRSQSEGKWHAAPFPANAESPVPCIVVLPPGTAALRKSPVPKDNDKEAEEVLRAEAERTLLRTPELGCSDTRTVTLEQGTIGIMAWLPSEFLYLCFEQAAAHGFAPKAVQAPEFNLASPEPTLLISGVNNSIRLCIIHEHTPLAWLSIPAGGPDMRAGIQALLSRAEDSEAPLPGRVLVWDGAALSHAPDSRTTLQHQLEKAVNAAAALLPEAAIQRTEGVEGLLPHLRLRRESLLSGNKTAFRPCLSQWESTPLTKKDMLRLCAPVTCAVLSCLLMFMAVVHLYDKEASALDKEASQLKILAARSDDATNRIRTFGERKRDILRYTTGKPFAFTMFRSLSKAAPNEVKVTSLRLGRAGEVTVNGEAGNEVSLISFLTNLNTSRYFNNAMLASMTRDKQAKKVKFVIAFEYTPWKKFFKQENEAEK